ncbi:MAG: DnaA regulatory inactivator Hda [Burkholderiales bacterium]|nr:DnaA regulatory inactivator Hda [Burkholderiales bacterium]
MKQLALSISPPPRPTLDNFVPGANAELLAHLRRLQSGRFSEGVLYLWGEEGCGKSHLLAACGADKAVDDVETLDETAQIRLFQDINEARQAGAAVLAAGNAPPARLPLREDLRSRLAWGLVYQVKPLGDGERAAFLRAESARRGLRLADDLIAYLLTHMRRDLRSLTAVLDRLDQYSLETKRPITLPLVRDAFKK